MMKTHMLQILEKGKLDHVRSVKALRESPYMKILKPMLEGLDTEMLYESEIHGIGHVERTMLLGAIIALEQCFSAEMALMTVFACAYHDIGRQNDMRDQGHGKRSALMMEDIKHPWFSDQMFKCIQAAVATHSESDRFIDEFADEFGVKEKNLETARTLCKALKDADGLDRVRLGDLDVSRLRFEESRLMNVDAEVIYNVYDYETRY